MTGALQKRSDMYGFYGSQDVKIINSDPAYWALEAFYAYRTYKSPGLLDIAKSVYNLTYSNAFINVSAAASGTGAGRDVSFVPPEGCPFSKPSRPPSV